MEVYGTVATFVQKPNFKFLGMFLVVLICAPFRSFCGHLVVVVLFFSLICFYVVSFFAFSLILDMLFRTDKGSLVKSEFHDGDSTSNKK